MKTYKTLMAALAASLALFAAVSTAGAAHLSVSNQGFRVVYSPFIVDGFANEVRCDLTLEGSFSSPTIVKGSGTQIGSVSVARISRPCTGGEMWVYNGAEVLGITTLASSLPWRVLYAGFEGTLPNITAMLTKLIGERLLVESTVLGVRVRCIYTSEELQPATGKLVRNTTTGVISEDVAGGTIESVTGGCPSIRLLSRGAVTLQGSTALVTLTLI